jgi:hypothetical protein
MADIDAAFEQKVFDLTDRQRIADLHYHSQADDLGRTVEISELISHPTKLRITADMPTANRLTTYIIAGMA